MWKLSSNLQTSVNKESLSNCVPVYMFEISDDVITLVIFRYRIAGIFRGGKFSHKPLQLYYSNYSRAEFSRNAPSSAKNYPFCTELTVRAALCNHTLARHLFAG